MIFCWFGRGDEVSKAAFECMTVHNYAEARRLWLSAAQNRGDQVWEHARQGALVSTLALLNPGNAAALEASLQAWRAVLDSEEFWKSFEAMYRFDGEFTANADVLAAFRKEAAALVSDIFAECQSASGATNYVHAFQTAFAAKGARVKRIFVPPPDFDARKEMFRICLLGRPHDQDMNFDALAQATESFVSSDIELIVTEAARDAVEGNKERIDESMIANVIHRFPPSVSAEEIAQYDSFAHLERW